jgi:hypothetical protein
MRRSNLAGAASALALALALLLAPSGPAHAGYVFFGSRAAFLAAAGTVGTETFDELASLRVFPAGTVLDGVTYTGVTQTSGPVTWEAIPGQPGLLTPESPPNVFGVGPGFTAGQLWFGGGSATSFGLAVVASGSATPQAPLLYQVEFFGADGSRHDVVLTLTGPGPAYVGAVATGGDAFAEIALIAMPGGNPPLIDDVAHSAVTPGSFNLLAPAALPGPGSWVMLGLGLAGVGAARRRRRREIRSR